MISNAIGSIKGRISSAFSKAPPPPKPVAEMSVIEIAAYNKIPGQISVDRWWLFAWFVMMPLTVVQGCRSYFYEVEHNKHFPPPYIPYDHMNNLSKPYPWGDGTKSLFHHWKWNAIPGVGYEWEQEGWTGEKPEHHADH